MLGIGAAWWKGRAGGRGRASGDAKEETERPTGMHDHGHQGAASRGCSAASSCFGAKPGTAECIGSHQSQSQTCPQCGRCHKTQHESGWCELAEA